MVCATRQRCLCGRQFRASRQSTAAHHMTARLWCLCAGAAADIGGQAPLPAEQDAGGEDVDAYGLTPDLRQRFDTMMEGAVIRSGCPTPHLPNAE